MRRRSPSVLRATAACLCLVASACSSPRANCGSACGTAVILIRNEPDALLPGVAQSTDAIGIADLLFLKLADLGPAMNTVGDSGFLPRLAKSWRDRKSVV